MRIGEVAAEAGVNPQTLRYYERRGLLPEPERGNSGYRAYDPDTVGLVRFIKRAQGLASRSERLRISSNYGRLRDMAPKCVQSPPPKRTGGGVRL